MKLSDYAKYINTKVEFKLSTGINFRVVIKDVKNSYGKVRFLISPVAGSGETWIEDRNLTLDR